MDARSSEAMRRRVLEAIELYELAEEMVRTRLRRQFPSESNSDIEERVRAWRHERLGAEHGDGPGRVIAWPRR